MLFSFFIKRIIFCSVINIFRYPTKNRTQLFNICSIAGSKFITKAVGGSSLYRPDFIINIRKINAFFLRKGRTGKQQKKDGKKTLHTLVDALQFPIYFNSEWE